MLPPDSPSGPTACAAVQDRLLGRRVRLRPLVAQDQPVLFSWVNTGLGLRWRSRGASVTFEDFVRGLWNQLSVHFMVHDLDADRPCGYLNAYGASQRDGWAYVSGFAGPGYEGSGYLAEAAILFVDHLFAHWPYRKLYFEVPDYNRPTMAWAMGTLFAEEGRRKEHHFFDGRYHDDATYALWRGTWEKEGPSLVALASAAGLRGTALSQDGGPAVLGIDEFARRLATTLDLDPAEVSTETELSRDLGVDSLQLLLLLCLVEDLSQSGTVSDLTAIPRTVREAYLLYCELASSPPMKSRPEGST